VLLRAGHHALHRPTRHLAGGARGRLRVLNRMSRGRSVLPPEMDVIVFDAPGQYRLRKEHVTTEVSIASPPAAQHAARLRAIVAHHFDPVWRALKRLGVPEAGVDDAAQQVFIVASRRLAEIERGREREYLLGIALRVASDARRALSRRREVPIE